MRAIFIFKMQENPVTGRKADVLQAAYLAAEVAQRLVKPGNENVTITENIQKVGDSFKCKPVEGTLFMNRIVLAKLNVLEFCF